MESDHSMVQIELRTAQALIQGLWQRCSYKQLWLAENRRYLQFDSQTLHAYGFQLASWRKGRIPVQLDGETLYFDSDSIFGLLNFVGVRSGHNSGGFGSH